VSAFLQSSFFEVVGRHRFSQSFTLR
jgi:hypothetical protein